MTEQKAAAGGAAIVAPNVRDFAPLEQAVLRFLGEKMPAAKGLALSNFAYPRGAGLSHETILFDAQWTEEGEPKAKGLVIRIKPQGEANVYQDDMFEEQFRVLEVQHRAGAVPIAKPLWFERDPSIVGAPFFIMEKVLGRVPVSYPPYSREGWMTELSPAQMRKLWTGAVKALAHTQRAPLSEFAFLDPEGRFPDGFEQEWDRWVRYYAWVMGERSSPFLAKVWALIGESRPEGRVPGLVWGDARIGNIMFDDDQNVAAVMDWEQISLGGALHDLAWWVLIQRLSTTQQGIPLLPGMGTREETIALWAEETGFDVSDIDWYERFTAFKLALLGVRMLDLRGASGAPGSNVIENPPIRLLAELFDLPPPTSEEWRPR